MLMYTFNVFESTSSQHKYYSRENCMIFYLIYMVNFIWIHSRPSFLNLQNHILVAIPWQTISLSFISLASFCTWFSIDFRHEQPWIRRIRNGIPSIPLLTILIMPNILFRFLCYVPLLLHAPCMCWTADLLIPFEWIVIIICYSLEWISPSFSLDKSWFPISVFKIIDFHSEDNVLLFFHSFLIPPSQCDLFTFI